MITRSAPSATSAIDVPRRACDSVTVRTVRPGVNVAASWAQVDTTLVGATTRNGAGPLGPGVGDQRQRLQRLAEPHVVGEDPAEPGRPQVGQPAEAVELVGPQLGLQPGRLDLRQRGQPAQRLRRPDPLRGLRVDEADLGELVPQPEVVVGEPDPLAGLVVQLGAPR